MSLLISVLRYSRNTCNMYMRRINHHLCERSCLNPAGICPTFRRKMCDAKNIPERLKKKLPFETDTENIMQETLLYTCYSMKRNAIMVSVGGTFVSIVMAQSAELIYRYSGGISTKPVEKAPWYYWWKNIDYGSNTLKYTMMAIMAVAAAVVFSFSMMYPKRLVREITLLKGGKDILLQTYGPFGRTSTMETSLKNVSAQWGPKQAKTVLPVKVKGRFLMFQIYTQEGQFYNRLLFDDTIGRFRF